MSLAINPAVSQEIGWRLLQTGDLEIAVGLLQVAGRPATLLMAIARDKRVSAREAVARYRGGLLEEIQLVLARDRKEIVRKMLVQNPDCCRAVLELMR